MRENPPPNAEVVREEPAREDAEPELMLRRDEEALRRRWTDVQSGFVDEPKRAVQQADELVAEVVKRITDIFARERATLEEQWARQEQASTESLRVALQRYRAFFDRLLGMTTH